MLAGGLGAARSASHGSANATAVEPAATIRNRRRDARFGRPRFPTVPTGPGRAPALERSSFASISVTPSR
jgi:hypothetical protein